MWLSRVPKAQSWETKDVKERRTATPSEAILAVSRLLGEVAASETPEEVRGALVREARALFVADGAVLLGVDPEHGTLTVLETDPPDAGPVPGPAPLDALPTVSELLERGLRTAPATPADFELAPLVGWAPRPRRALFVAIPDREATPHVLALTSARAAPFSADEQELAAAFATAA